MKKSVKALVLICLCILGPCSSEIIKLFKTDGRSPGVFKTFYDYSAVKCSVLYENTPQALSFNYHEIDRTCELSNLYPESSTTELNWKVYGRIVDGVWGNWLNWGSCSKPCGGGTRSRSRLCNNPSPSNGGEQCQGSSTQSQSCNNNDCNGFVNGHFLSTDTLPWASAKSACEGMSAQLVIFESQQEIDDIIATFNIQGFYHWIGMTCTSGQNCVWLDGRTAESGFQAWAPNEPNGANCVWIGSQSTLWDDAGCEGNRYYICELL